MRERTHTHTHYDKLIGRALSISHGTDDEEQKSLTELSLCVKCSEMPITREARFAVMPDLCGDSSPSGLGRFGKYGTSV